MNFRGNARKLSPSDVSGVAEMIDAREAHIRTIMEVEAAGHGFIPDGRPRILFEPHIFYREVKADPQTLKQAIRAGLAYPIQGTKPYPKGDLAGWKRFLQAYDLSPRAALMSTSWGLSQMMGFNHRLAGFNTPEEMVEAFCDSEREQLLGMIKFIQKRGIADDMLAFPDLDACRRFATVYNGKGYAKNRYHTKLRASFLKWDARERQAQSDDAKVEDGLLRMGSRGERVRMMQQMLKDKGYDVRPDAAFGNRTRDAVLAWQADAGRPLDASMDAADLAELERSPDRPVAPEREEATLAELSEESSIVRDGGTLNKALTVGGVVIGGSKGAEQVGLLDHAQEYIERGQDVAGHVEKVSGIWDTISYAVGFSGVGKILSFVASNALPIAFALGIVAFFLVCKMRKARLEMHRKGESA